ncbi:MAG: NFACT RNA binding domain-containing protein [Ignavibacteriaceae bacterium]|nr:NFACT RNA binding domain-containing protein [Ignavibacteriaceae bacterium]
MKKLRIKSVQEKEAKDDLSLRFKHYVIEGKYDLYVGKDSKNNDLLTTKFAKQNDYWFHARGASGSHAVLRIHNTKEPVPKSVLKKSASIAAFHSKAKTAGIVPVAFTFKKYVVKKKGDPVGTVHLLREDVLLVKPEIPAGCEYVSSQD